MLPLHRPRGRPRSPGVLTPSERDVLTAVRRGLSNGQIAALRGVTLNTVRTQVASMLAKLDLPNRKALAKWGAKMNAEVNGAVLGCSFCNKPRSQVKVLIAGPGVLICDECIALGSSIIARHAEGHSSALFPPPATEGALRILQLAREQATRRGADRVGEMHVLAALQEMPECLAAVALESLGLSASRLSGPERTLSASGAAAWQPGDAAVLIDDASAQARALSHDYVGTEHVLLAILARKGEAARILEDHGVTYDALQTRVKELIDGTR